MALVAPTVTQDVTLEIIKTVIPFFIALATAFVGLTIWRYQQIAQRRLAVAEEALVAFWEAAEALKAARSRGMFGNEGKSRPRAPDEDTDVGEERDTYWVVRERLAKTNDRFARLSAAEKPFQFYFGEVAASPIGELFKVRWEVAGAVDILIQTAIPRAFHGAGMYNDREAFMRTAFATPDEDKVADRIAALEKQIEAVCLAEQRRSVRLVPGMPQSQAGAGKAGH